MNKKALFLIFLLIAVFTSNDMVFAAINGQCGSAHLGHFTSFPSSGLCSQGTFSSSEASTFEDYRWKCVGIDGGTTASCYAYLDSVTYPVCASFPNNQTSVAPGPTERCRVGKSSWITPHYSGSVISYWTWDCQGTGTTTSPVITCSVKYSGASTPITPTSTKINGSCGSSSGQTFSNAPSSGLCSSGIASSVTGSGSSYWLWTCSGQNGGTNESCMAYKKRTNCCITPINGQCGSSNNQTFSNAPSSGLCSSGIASSVTGSGPWTWTCSGQNGGSSASCSAFKTQTNNSPNVYAGSNRDVQSGQSIYLNASASDPDGDYLTYSWTCNGGHMSSYSILNPTYYAPNVSYDTTYTCTLTANDGRGGYASDSLDILVRNVQQPINGQCGSSNNQTFSNAPSSGLCSSGIASSVTGSGPWYWTCSGQNGGSSASCSAFKTQTNNSPNVYAGSNRDVQSGQSIYLNASASDPDGDYLTYSWTCNGGHMSSYSILNPIYYAPNISYNTTYTCTLTVTDTKGLSASSSFNVYIRSSVQQNNNPYVNAGSNRDVQSGQSIYLNASASDPDGDYLTYSWTCNGGSLSSYSILNPTYYAPNVSYDTTYTCTLTANDGRGGYASGSINIYVKGYNYGGGYYYNNSPNVYAGSNRDVQSGQSIYLNASASDPDGDYLTYSWTCNGGSLSSYSILNPTYYAPNVSYDTTYTCTLRVSDSRGASSSDSINIYVKTYYSKLNISTNNANNITINSARLNAYLEQDGGQNTSIRFNWGKYGYLGNYTSWIDYKRSPSYVYADIYNLEKGKAYQFRTEAKNGRETVYGSTLSFITKPDSPSYFDAILINAYQVNLTWTRGQGSCNTSITRKLNSYPTSITDGKLVYYGNNTLYTDYDVAPGNVYYYRAWSIGCDAGLYSVSDSLYSKDFVTIKSIATTSKPVVTTPVVQKCNLGIDVLGRNLSQNETVWKDSIYAKPNEEVEITVNITALDCNLENVILTNILPVKIDDVYDLKGEGQTFCGDDASGSFILGSITKGKTKTIVFKMKISGEESFSYDVTDLDIIAEANAKNIETVRDTLEIRVSKGVGEEAVAGLERFINRNWKIFYIFFGLLLGLIIFLIILYFLRENDKKKKLKEENMLLEKSKYFHIQ